MNCWFLINFSKQHEIRVYSIGHLLKEDWNQLYHDNVKISHFLSVWTNLNVMFASSIHFGICALLIIKSRTRILIQNLVWNSYYECSALLTLLNCSRLQTVLPKNRIAIGCWALAIITGKIRWNLVGNKYQHSWWITPSSSPNTLLNRWPVSLAKNTRRNVQNPQKIDSHNTTESILSCDWKKTD